MISDAEHKAIESFLYKEARLADESRYDEWEALWDEDAVYWVPATTREDADPNRHISHIYDNRARIATRIRLLKSGMRYSQTPVSSIRRVISNIEIEKTGAGEFVVGSNFLLLELAVQGKHETHLWGGRTIHQLRSVNGELKMFGKKVILINASEPISNLTFLI